MEDMQVIRTYRFESGTSGRRLVCESHFPDLGFSGDYVPDVKIEIEQGDRFRNARVLKPQIHVYAPLNTPRMLVLQELERFITTFKQMYSL